MRLNLWLSAAAILSALTTGVHLFMGGPEIIEPVINAGGLAQEVRSVSYVVWHGITAQLALTSLLLLMASYDSRWNGRMLWFPLAQYALFAALFIVIAVKDFGNLLALPQWIAFAAITGLAAAGLRRQPNLPAE